MSTTTHTPGPWTAAGPGIRETAGHDPRIMVLHPDGVRLIATTREGCTRPDGATISKDEQRANARLIAAAPELLAALKGIIDQACVNGCPTFESADGEQWCTEHTPECIAARAAIAKAEGGAE